AERIELALEILRLRSVAGIAVEHETRRGIRFREPFLDHAEHDLVGNELAGIHRRFRAAAELRAVGNGLTQQVAGRYLHPALLRLQALRLRPLAGPRRAEHDDPHSMTSRSMRGRVSY